MGVLELRRLDGTLLRSFNEVPEGTVVHREIMGEHYLKLPFTTKSPFYLRIGDYVNTDYGKFELTKPYKPRYNTRTSGYDYDLQLDAYYMKWKNKKVRYMPEYGAKEVTFKLTANIDTHLNVVLRTVNALATKDANFRYNGRNYDVQLLNFPADKRTTAKYYLYDRTDIISALDGLAQLYDCEWWVEDNIIFFGKCEIGSDSIEFNIDVNVDEMSRSESDTQYATRLYAFGSTRNLPHNYEDVGADVTVDGVVQKRLPLPASLCPNGYLQDVQVRNETEAIEGVLVNEDIYPKVECVVGEVTTYDSEVEEDDGTTTRQTFYRLKDSSGFQFSEDMILEGESLHILFQSGSMNGMDFECHYDNEGKYYEVIVNEDYGRLLPDATLHPVVGMKFVLYNWDATKIESTGIIEAAKRKLFDYTFEYLKESKIDPSTYDCTMKSVWVYNDGLHFRTFDIGSRVRLVNDAFFEESRTSRIIGFEIKLDKPYDTPKYTVGEKAAYSRRKDMERQIESVTVNGNAYAPYSGSGIGGGGGTGGGTSIYVIKRYDGAIPSDYNVFSAKRAQDEFLSRKDNDTALGHINFKKGLTAEMLSKFIGGAYFGTFIEGLKGGKIDENGDAELNNLIVRLKAVINELKVQGRSEFGDSLMSDDFTSGFIGGKGWAIMKERVQNALGVYENKYTGEFDNLVVRGALRIFTLVVSQLLGENDNRIFTAMLEVHHYDPTTGRVWFDTRNGKLYNPFRVGDYIMVQQYNGMPDSSNEYYVTKHYECVVTGAGLGNMSDGENRLDWVTIKNFLSADGKLPNDVIKKGDTFCRVDNETDADRKGIIQIITVGAQTPYMDIHYGLKTSPQDAHKGRIGNLKGINHYLFGQLQDFGAYLINLYAVGDFRVKRTGESVDAQIEMLKNQFATQFQQTTYEMTEDDNYLTNASFTQNMEGWTTQTDKTTMLTIDGTPLVINGATSIYGMSFARIENYEGRRMLRLRKTQIEQINGLIRKPSTHKEYDTPSGETTDTYKEVRDKLYLSIRYYVVGDGKMTLGFKQSAADIADEPADERAKFMPFMNQQTKQVTGKWVTEQFEGTWNGKGTFVLSFTGELFVSMLSVTDHPLDEFKRTVSTQIMQDSENVKILGQNISLNGAAITNLGIELRAKDQEIELYINKEIGNVTSLINTANKAISDLEDATDKLRNLTDEVFKDGIVDNAERIAIEKYLNDLATAYRQMEGAYSDMKDNVYLNKTENAGKKTNLVNAWKSLDTYYQTLVNTITAVIADGLATDTEIAQVNTAFTNYNSAVKTFNVRLKEAEEAIEDWIKNYVDAESVRLGLLIDGVNEQVTIYANKLTTEYYTAAQIDVKIGAINLAVTQMDADYQKKISDINGDISAAQTAITNLQEATGDLSTYIDGAFYDGIIENAEKVGIEKYLNDLATAYNLMNATYSKIYDNEYLKKNTTGTNTARSNLATAKTNLDTYYNALRNKINSVIADGKVTTSEKNEVNTAFSNYNSAVTTLNQRFEEAQKAIEDWMKDYVDSENASLQAKAEALAAAAALGEYYEQGNNPWNSWPSGSEIKHIGAKWKVTSGTASRTYYEYDESGNLTRKTVETGKLYRFIGSSSGQNVWESIDDIQKSIAYLAIRKDYIAAVAANFDTNGNVRSSSSIVTNAWSNILAVNEGDLTSKIQQVAGAITISADRIHLEGYVTANYGFSIDRYGTMSCTNANVSGKVTATSGSIGGFTISGNGLTNTSANSSFDNDAYIILRNDQRKCFVGIGPNVTPAYSSLRALGRFEIEDSSSWWGGYNAALVLHAKNGAQNNFAFVGSGNGVLNGWIAGYMYSRYVCTSNDTIYDGYITLKDNNQWIVRSSASNSGVALPKLTAVRNALGIGTSTKFCLRLLITADLGTNDFTVYGRNGKKSSSGTYPWQTDELPLITHWDGGRWEEVGMAAGDTIEFLLVYDPSRSQKIDNFTTYYTARVINQQN